MDSSTIVCYLLFEFRINDDEWSWWLSTTTGLVVGRRPNEQAHQGATISAFISGYNSNSARWSNHEVSTDQFDDFFRGWRSCPNGAVWKLFAGSSCGVLQIVWNPIVTHAAIGSDAIGQPKKLCLTRSLWIEIPAWFSFRTWTTVKFDGNGWDLWLVNVNLTIMTTSACYVPHRWHATR